MHYSDNFYVTKGKKVKIKKLVLGFGVYAAITGAVPRIFGVTFGVTYVFAKYELPSEMLAAAIPDAESRAGYEDELKALEKRLEEATLEFEKMGDDEVDYVKNALLC
jgi:hypothetical protein